MTRQGKTKIGLLVAVEMDSVFARYGTPGKTERRGGFDVFQAGRRVGKSGRAIGVDMTWEMLEKARHNIAVYRDTTGLDNVEFRLGEIEHLPVADASVDVAIECAVKPRPSGLGI